MVTQNFWRTTVILSALTASPFAFSAIKTIDTEILKVNRPQNGITVYTAQAADGRIYTASPANPESSEAIAQLERLAQEGSPKAVHITLRFENAEAASAGDDEIIGISEMSPAEALALREQVRELTSEELHAAVEGNANLDRMEEPGLLGTLESNSSGIDETETPIPEAILEAQRDGYSPTILASMADARRLYLGERPLDHDSQCHQRAMRWAVDMWNREGIKSMKVMMFFTERFQTTYVRVSQPWYRFGGYEVKPYKWWYHTAPYVYVGNKEIVLDREFLDSEVTMDQWTHYFLSDFIHEWTTVLREQGMRRDYQNYVVNRDGERVTWSRGGRDYYIPLVNRLSSEQTKCRVMKRYQERMSPQLTRAIDALPADSQEWCLVRKLPMYYYTPQTFERRDCNPSTDNYDSSRGGFRNGDRAPLYPCLQEAPRLSWDEWSLRDMMRAGDRDPDPRTGR